MIFEPSQELPVATLERFISYFRKFEELSAQNCQTVSSQELADSLGITAAIIRKDLSYLGNLGTRGTGYDIDTTKVKLINVLGLNRCWYIVIFGAGNLGRAIAQAPGFSQAPYSIGAIYDIKPKLLGTEIGSLKVQDFNSFPSSYKLDIKSTIAVITTPENSAQLVAKAAESAGIRAIFNFAPVNLNLSSLVRVRNVDLAAELGILTYHLLNCD